MTFKDHFSTCPASYARYRPRYPRALFDFIGNLGEQHRVVWDCATGNGQAAVELARYFDHIIATDASQTQIAQATPHPGVEYRVAMAEESGIPDTSVDVVTVAQALHWFDVAKFFAEVRRVATPDAAIVVWSYGDPFMDDGMLNTVLQRFNTGTLAPYWPTERHTCRRGYDDVPFPFREVPTPSLLLEHEWTLDELVGYLRTWSAVTAYRASHNVDPVTECEEEMRKHWPGERATRVIRWPLSILAGRVT